VLYCPSQRGEDSYLTGEVSSELTEEINLTWEDAVEKAAAKKDWSSFIYEQVGEIHGNVVGMAFHKAVCDRKVALMAELTETLIRETAACKERERQERKRQYGELKKEFDGDK